MDTEKLSPDEKILLAFFLGAVSALSIVGAFWNFGILAAGAAGAG